MPAQQKKSEPTFATARDLMVDTQLRPHRVRNERVLTAMGKVPRELFVPTASASLAYVDEDIEVGTKRYLMQPMVLGRLLQEANVTAKDLVLDIAPATGYSSAVLASLAKNVTAVETDTGLAETATKNLQALKIKNATVMQGALVEGWVKKAPYNVILINGSVESVPNYILAQLAEDGRLLAVVRQNFGIEHSNEARIYEKKAGIIAYRSLFNANLRPLHDFDTKAGFVF